MNTLFAIMVSIMTIKVIGFCILVIVGLLGLNYWQYTIARKDEAKIALLQSSLDDANRVRQIENKRYDDLLKQSKNATERMRDYDSQVSKKDYSDLFNTPVPDGLRDSLNRYAN